MNEHAPKEIAAPDLPYQPRLPRHYRPPIGLIGCGGITDHHLTAYRNAGLSVVAFCDLNRDRAEQQRDKFFPDAEVCQDYRDLLRKDEIEVVDIATHPPERPEIIKAAVRAGKHVLSQKPFVLDLDVGRRLVDLADEHGVCLAVNQNGRWAPHFAYLRAAVESGLLGPLASAQMSVHWDHTWVEGTPFEQVDHLILYDYAIHWFDMVNCLFADQSAIRVFAGEVPTSWQSITPPLLAHASITFENAHAVLAFNADTRHGSQDRTYVVGSKGTISSVGPGNRIQHLTMTTAEGVCQPVLEGSWFPDGFQGTMCELLCAIEDNRTPSIDARRNLDSLALCFAAVVSARQNEPIRPWDVIRLSKS